MAAENYEIWVRTLGHQDPHNGWAQVQDTGGQVHFVGFQRVQQIARAKAAIPGTAEVVVFERRPVLRLNGTPPEKRQVAPNISSQDGG